MTDAVTSNYRDILPYRESPTVLPEKHRTYSAANSAGDRQIMGHGPFEGVAIVNTL